MLKTGRWARKYEACLECGSTAEPHYAKGYCGRCYMRLYKRHQRRSQRGQVAATLQTPPTQTATP